ncbi:MAG: KH domain-containing protein [Acidobacteria bacterium]|nr:KH domain-containing protein [Acidobacteriota bacterium]
MPKLEKDLKKLVSLLVDDSEEVFVEEVRLRGGNRRLFEVEVSADDAGKVIGRQGRTVRALRSLLELRGRQDGLRYELEVFDT